MRIQLAPWEVTDTSLKLGTEKRSRKQLDNQSDGQPAFAPSLPLAACFARRSPDEGASRRKTRRLKQHQPHNRIKGWQPVLVITLGHHIVALGNDSKSLANQTSFAVKENPDFQYHSRLDTSSEFIPLAQLKRAIPAVVDDLHDRIYALQGDNGKLVSWQASTGGPDLGAIVVKLQSAAVSLSFTTTPAGWSLVYGSCADRSVFLGRIIVDDSGSEAWLVEYLPAASITNARDGPTNDDRHIHTRIYIESTAPGFMNVSGSKRKLETPPDSSPSLSVYQVFRNATDSGLLMSKRQVSISAILQTRKEPLAKADEGLRQEVVSIPLSKKGTLRDARSIGAPTNALLDLAYTVAQKKDLDTASLFHVSIDLETGCCSGPAFQLSPDVHQLKTVGHNFLVGASRSSIFLYDRKRGVRIHESKLELLNTGDSFSLLGDDASDRLAVVVMRGDELCVATTSLIGDVSSLSDVTLNLAQSLALSVGSVPVDQYCQDLLRFDFEKPWINPHNSGNALKNAVSILTATRDDLLCGRKLPNEETALSHAFERALESFVDIKSLSLNQKEHVIVENGVNGMLNGVHLNGKSKHINGKSIPMNGCLEPGDSPSGRTPSRLIPHIFVEPATSACVDLLTTKSPTVPTAAFQDAVRLLARLIKTGQVSARRSLPPVTFMELLRAVDRAQGAEALHDIVFLVLNHVSDVSEYHMVCMLQRHARKALEPGQSSVPLRPLLQLLDQLVKYSAINDALLRSAAKDVLTQEEVCAIVRLLVTLLGSVSLQACRLRALKWIGVLSELVQGEQAGNSHISTARQHILHEVKTLESMISIKRLVESRIYTLAAGVTDDGNPRPSMPDQQAPYQIERLVF